MEHELSQDSSKTVTCDFSRPVSFSKGGSEWGCGSEWGRGSEWGNGSEWDVGFSLALVVSETCSFTESSFWGPSGGHGSEWGRGFY